VLTGATAAGSTTAGFESAACAFILRYYVEYASSAESRRAGGDGIRPVQDDSMAIFVGDGEKVEAVETPVRRNQMISEASRITRPPFRS
jgi:hypothetical protein